MLKPAYLSTNKDEINRLITEGNYDYVYLSNYTHYEVVDEIYNDEWNQIQKTSVDTHGNILGYFSASVNMVQKKITGTLFVKFKYKYTEYAKNTLDPERRCVHIEGLAGAITELEDISRTDFHQFVDEIMTHPIYNRIEFRALVNNPANRIYEKFMEKYNGERFFYRDSIILRDGQYHDEYKYWFNRKKNV